MSRRFLLYLLLLGAAYSLYSYSGIQELLFLLVMMLALPLCSFFILFISRFFVRVSLSAPKKQVYRLEPFSLFLDIENRGPFFFPLIRIEFNLPRSNSALQPDYDWSKGAQRNSQGVHFFNEYLDMMYPDEEQSEGEAETARSMRYLLDRRKVFRFYPYPHRVVLKKIITAVLPQMSTSHQEIRMTAAHRGVYEVGTSSILLQDLFGFFYLPLPRSSRRGKDGSSRLIAEMEVLPNPYRWHSPQAGKLRAPEEVLMNTRNLKVSNEVDTVANVRDYRPGDRIKQIHWKLSARSDKFLAREFEDPRQGGILFLIDPKLPDDCADPVSYADEVPEIMASIMRMLAMTEGPLNLVLGEEYFTAPGEGVEPYSFYRAMMHWKPEIRPDDPRNKDPETKLACKQTPHRLELGTILQKECYRQRYRAIVVLTARMNKRLASELQRAQKVGSQLLLIFLHNEKKEDLNRMLAPLAKANIRLFPTRLDSLVPYESILDNTNGRPGGTRKKAGSGQGKKKAASSRSSGKKQKAAAADTPRASAASDAPASSADNSSDKKDERRDA